MINEDEIKEDDWLWCLHCQRFFQAKDRCIDSSGFKTMCAFEDCNGSIHDISTWDGWVSQNPELKEHWPKSTDELKKGMVCPLYP